MKYFRLDSYTYIKIALIFKLLNPHNYPITYYGQHLVGTIDTYYID